MNLSVCEKDQTMPKIKKSLIKKCKSNRVIKKDVIDLDSDGQADLVQENMAKIIQEDEDQKSAIKLAKIIQEDEDQKSAVKVAKKQHKKKQQSKSNRVIKKDSEKVISETKTQEEFKAKFLKFLQAQHELLRGASVTGDDAFDDIMMCISL